MKKREKDHKKSIQIELKEIQMICTKNYLRNTIAKTCILRSREREKDRKTERERQKDRERERKRGREREIERKKVRERVIKG